MVTDREQKSNKKTKSAGINSNVDGNVTNRDERDSYNKKNVSKDDDQSKNLLKIY